MAEPKKVKSVRELRHLTLLVAQDGEGFETYVAPNLCFGDVWWIPDKITGFGDKERHPWVIVKAYSPYRVNVVACPRTTSIGSQGRGILTPAGVLPGLSQEGQLVLAHRRSFGARQFIEFEYIGRLPAAVLARIEDFYHALAARRNT